MAKQGIYRRSEFSFAENTLHTCIFLSQKLGPASHNSLTNCFVKGRRQKMECLLQTLDTAFATTLAKFEISA